MALITDDDHARFGYPHKAGGITTVVAVNGLASRRVDADELIDQCGIAGKGIAEKVLANAQPQANDCAGIREKGSRLDPHIVSSQWDGGESNQCNEQPTNDFHMYDPF